MLYNFRGIDVDDPVAGRAFVGTMCTGNSVGFTEDGGRTRSQVFAIAAHELGHIFNMDHDDGSYCVATLCDHYSCSPAMTFVTHL